MERTALAPVDRAERTMSWNAKRSSCTRTAGCRTMSGWRSKFIAASSAPRARKRRKLSRRCSPIMTGRRGGATRSSTIIIIIRRPMRRSASSRASQRSRLAGPAGGSSRSRRETLCFLPSGPALPDRRQRRFCGRRRLSSRLRMGHLHRGGDIGNLREDAARADPGAQSADGNGGDIRTIGTSERGPRTAGPRWRLFPLCSIIESDSIKEYQ